MAAVDSSWDDNLVISQRYLWGSFNPKCKTTFRNICRLLFIFSLNWVHDTLKPQVVWPLGLNSYLSLGCHMNFYILGSKIFISIFVFRVFFVKVQILLFNIFCFLKKTLFDDIPLTKSVGKNLKNVYFKCTYFLANIGLIKKVLWIFKNII